MEPRSGTLERDRFLRLERPSATHRGWLRTGDADDKVPHAGLLLLLAFAQILAQFTGCRWAIPDPVTL